MSARRLALHHCRFSSSYHHIAGVLPEFITENCRQKETDRSQIREFVGAKKIALALALQLAFGMSNVVVDGFIIEKESLLFITDL